MTRLKHTRELLHSGSSRRAKFLVFLGAILGVLSIASVALAFFTSHGVGTASASAGALNPPTGVTVPSAVTGTTVAVSWTAASEPVTLSGYYVQRFSGATPSPACGTSPTSLISTTACSDSGLSSGTYTYKVTAVFSSWTASASSGSVTVTAQVLDHFTLSPSASPTAGVPFSVTISAIDQNGNTDPNYTGPQCVTFSGPASSPNSTAPVYPARGSCSSGSAVTFASGVATGANAANITLFDAQSVTLTLTDNPSGKTGTTPLTVGAATLSAFTVSAPGAQVAGVSFNDTAIALDAWGNAASGWVNNTDCVAFSGPANSPNVTPPSYPAPGTCGAGNSSVTFNASGQATASITLFDAQSTSLTVTSLTTPSGKTGSSGTFAVTAGTLNSFTVPTPAAQTAGTLFNETVTALDTWGNAASGWTSATNCVTFSGPSNAPNGTAPTYGSQGSCAAGQTSLTFAAGQATASVTLYKAQSTSLTVTSVTAPAGKTGVTGTFTVSPKAADSGGSLTLAAATTTPVAGQGDKLTVTAFDQYLNPDTNYTGNKSLVFSGASANGPFTPTVTNSAGTATNFGSTTTITFAAGVATVSGTSNNGLMTLYKVQTTSIVVSDGTITNGSGLSVTVSGGAASSFTVSNPGTQTAGVAFSETVTALDAYGNTATYTGSHTLTWSGPTASPGPVTAPLYPSTATAVTFTNGVGTASAITLYDAVASVTLNVSATGPVNGSTSFPVNSGGANLSFSSTPPTLSANHATWTSTVAIATDAYGNAPRYAGAGVTITLTLASGVHFSIAAGSTGSATASNTTPASITATGTPSGTFTVEHIDAATGKPDTLTASSTAPGFTSANNKSVGITS